MFKIHVYLLLASVILAITDKPKKQPFSMISLYGEYACMKKEHNSGYEVTGFFFVAAINNQQIN